MKYGKLYLRIREHIYFLKFSLIIDKVIREKEEHSWKEKKWKEKKISHQCGRWKGREKV